MKYLKLFEEYTRSHSISREGDINQHGGLTIKITDQLGKVIGNISIEAYDSGRVTDPDLEDFHQNTEGLPFDNSNTAYIHTLNVDPEHRKIGHGTTLVKAGEDAAKEFGKAYTIAIVSKANKNSQGLFKKAGYDKIIDSDKTDLLHKQVADSTVFEGFSDHMANQGHTLTSFYKKELQDFTLEQEILEKLAGFEQGNPPGHFWSGSSTWTRRRLGSP